MLVIKKQNVSSIIKDILKHKELEHENKEQKKKIQIEDTHLFFRGESKKYIRRTPSLYLEDKLLEKGSEYYYRTLLSELGRDDYKDNTSLVRLISELQHYGAKTRMLDVTKSPLIALYFAVEKDDDESGYIYIYNSTYSKEKFDTGHTVAIKCALNLINYEVINNFIETCASMQKTDKKEFERLKDKTQDEILSEYSNKGKITNNIKIFMELLNQRARVREKLIYPLKIFCDLKKAHIIIPSKTTDRIRQQQGAFIFPEYVNTRGKSKDSIQNEIDSSIQSLSAVLKAYDYNNKKIREFSCIEIEGKYKKQIRYELEQLGITAGYIYPDIEHQSISLLE